MRTVIIVGQTPPPFGGQAVMIQRLLSAEYANAKLVHVRMSFSKSMGDLGRFSFRKIAHAASVILRIAYARLRNNADTIYYPPSGPDRVPVLRDIVILVCTRWLFKRTMFHFHAAGLSEVYPSLSRPLKALFRAAYFYPDCAIKISNHNPDDPAFIRAKKRFCIPNGVEDSSAATGIPRRSEGNTCTILFVGLLTESKGVLVLLEALKVLRTSGLNARVRFVGHFASNEFERTVRILVASSGLDNCTSFDGVLTGRDKSHAYAAANIFCFPTFFESESFGLVAAEAMSFGLPIVVSNWRGVQSLVWEGENGFGVPPRDVGVLANRLSILVTDTDLRQRMGVRGRELFLENFTLDHFFRRMDECFGSL